MNESINKRRANRGSNKVSSRAMRKCLLVSGALLQATFLFAQNDAAAPAPAEPINKYVRYLCYAIAVLAVFVIYSLIMARRSATTGNKLPGDILTSIGRWITGHKKIVAGLGVVAVLVGMKGCWDGLKGIGITQGYAPEQPIKFSHKIHAGDNSIACVYCHSSVTKGKTAGIPSANVCMNCHKYIREGTVTGTTEIPKIYAALDYNAETGEYGPNQKPIEWVRVHNLPDFAYFNHSQHVVAGQQQCQTCHGQIQEMDVVQQYSPLTMKWCVDCHRTTEVKMASNSYYEQIHKKLSEKYKGQPITVDRIGGLDCAKCHY